MHDAIFAERDRRDARRPKGSCQAAWLHAVRADQGYLVAMAQAKKQPVS